MVKATTVEDLGALFTAMDSAIAYLECLPDFTTAKKIFRAAQLFVFPRYRDFALGCIEKLIIVEPHVIDETPSPFTALCVELSQEYKLPNGLIKPAYYDLARSPPPTPSSELATDMMKLTVTQIMRLNAMQKNLVSFWEDIRSAFSYRHECASCTEANKSRSPIEDTLKNSLSNLFTGFVCSESQT
ncbi:hypothetical protein NLJ89_g11372 [Agrocybe chaxingu]|uniref:Uncharacterized protein n=1 Tax=Agrocybe chaxingu TaxID=84603 RepID=A0A9W8JNU9_9AGAR|nr:hypothetical protein NLJ89_g11372 [Agrocybe chaxingu]